MTDENTEKETEQEETAAKVLADAKQDAVQMLADAQEAANKQKEEAVKVLADAQEAANKQKEEAAKVLADAQEAANKQKEEAAKALADAKEDMVKILADAQETANQKEEAAKALADAKQDAVKVLADAQEAANKQKEEAAKVLADAQEAANNQKEEAAKALADAKQDAAKVLADAQVKSNEFTVLAKDFAKEIGIKIGATSHGKEQKHHNESAKKWMRGVWLFCGLLTFFAFWGLFGFPLPSSISDFVAIANAAPNSDAAPNVGTVQSTLVAHGGNVAKDANIWWKWLANRALIVAVLSYGMFFCTKNYLAHRHNAVLSSHRLAALHAYTFLDDHMDNEKTDSRSIILTRVAQNIFDSQDSGFIRGGDSQGGKFPKSLADCIPSKP